MFIFSIILYDIWVSLMHCLNIATLWWPVAVSGRITVYFRDEKSFQLYNLMNVNLLNLYPIHQNEIMKIIINYNDHKNNLPIGFKFDNKFYPFGLKTLLKYYLGICISGYG